VGRVQIKKKVGWQFVSFRNQMRNLLAAQDQQQQQEQAGAAAAAAGAGAGAAAKLFAKKLKKLEKHSIEISTFVQVC
jgi:hypothetical protein